MFITIYGNECNNPVAYCHNRLHKGYLTARIMRQHECLQKGCSYMERLPCQFWEQREVIKQKRRERKEKRKAVMKK